MQCAGKGLNCGNPALYIDQDDEPAHTSILFRIYLTKHQTSVVPYPPYSPDIAQQFFFLFTKLKTALKGRRFQTIEQFKENAVKKPRPITESASREIFQQSKKGCEWFIASRGEFFEVDSA
jgi:hypothetical protein